MIRRKISANNHHRRIQEAIQNYLDLKADIARQSKISRNHLYQILNGELKIGKIVLTWLEALLKSKGSDSAEVIASSSI